MFSQQEAKTLLTNAWESAWIPGCPTISDFFVEDAEMSGFTPPKQTTWKGVDAIKAHFLEIQPILNTKAFTISRIDIVNDGKSFYAAFNHEFEVNMPGSESLGIMKVDGIMYCVVEGGKFKVFSAFEDPTMFVVMAMKGLMGEAPK